MAEANQAVKISNLTLCLGVCRSGTTALTQVFGTSGFAAFYQPLKGDLRLIRAGRMPINMQRIKRYRNFVRVFCKETLGPFFRFETDHNYLESYIKEGLFSYESPIIFTIRNPEQTFNSWLRQWGRLIPRERLFQNYLAAERNFTRLEHCALNYTSAVIYHWLEPARSADYRGWDEVFQVAGQGVEFNADHLCQWRISNYHDSEKIIFPLEPSFFSIKSIHATADRFGKYSSLEKFDHRKNKYQSLKLSPFERNQMINSGVFDSFEKRVASIQVNLSLNS